MRVPVVYIMVITPHERTYMAKTQGCILVLSMYTVCVRRAVNLHALHNSFKLYNIQSPNLQRKHSFRIENWFNQMRDLRREIYSSCLNWTKECGALGGFHSRGQVLRVSVRSQRPDIPWGPNACGYSDQQGKEKWQGSANRCQPSILPALELSGMKKVCLCVGSWVWMADCRQHLELYVSAVGCNSNGQTVLLDLLHELTVRAWGCLCFLCWLFESYWHPKKFYTIPASLTW